MSIAVDQRRAQAELKLAIRAAKADADRAERAARQDAARRRREARAAERVETRAARAARRAEHANTLVEIGHRLRPVAPLLVVTGCAMYGQIAFGVDAYSPAATPVPVRLLIAVAVAVGVESIALYVQWHAHDALLKKATATAARLRRVSYLIALGVAGVNFAHFYDQSIPAAVVFALFSASSPWLWGLHTRRVQHMQLLREGQADSTGAVFSAERFRAFPLRTIAARRWSIDHGVTDPREAWEGYRAEKAARAGAPTPEQRVALLVAVARLAAVKPAPAPKPRPQRDDVPKAEVSAPPTSQLQIVRPRIHQPTQARRGRSTILTDPPAVVLDLVAEGDGWPTLLDKIRAIGVEVNEYQSRELIKRYRPNNNQAATS
jgi:hypothetical protein